jgi:hypothetical protein
MAPPAKTFTREEVREHTSEDSLWCIIDSIVYDLSEFVMAHPGGESVLHQVAGQDATTAFYNLHRQEVLAKYADLAIGTIKDEKPQVIVPQPGDLSPVPYAEPLWLVQHFKNPYFNDSHRRLQKALREFTDKHLIPEAQECETTGRAIGQDMIDLMSRKGILHMRLGPGKHLHGVNLMDGAVKGEEFDYFHDMIVAQEFARTMTRGFQDGNMAGMTIGLTAVLNFAKNESWKKKIADEVFSGKKKLCLAITEAFAGSDVAGLRTTAQKTPDGKHYVSLQHFVPHGRPEKLTLLLDRKWHQEVDHQRYLLRLLCDGCPHRKGPQCRSHREGRGRRDQAHQDILLSHRRNQLRHL